MSPQMRRSPPLSLILVSLAVRVSAWIARRRSDPAVRPPRILLIKPHDQLGDFLVATPVFAVLKAQFPEARLELVTREYLAPLARRQGTLDAVHVLPRLHGVGGVVAQFRLLHALRSPPPAAALVLNSVSRSRTADWLALLSGASVVVGRSCVGAGEVEPDAPEDVFAYSKEISAAGIRRDFVYHIDLDVARGSVHQVDRLLDLLAWTDMPVPRTGPMTLDVTAAERVQGREFVRAALAAAGGTDGWSGPGPLVGIHPAAANALKCWPVDSFVELGTRIHARGAALVVFDTPKEPGPARAVVAGLARRGVAAGLVPAGSLDAFIAAASGLDLMVCNDSGVMHIAAALGVPTLSFHSLGLPAEWAPRGEKAIALHAEEIAAIPVDDAERAARRLLES
jgi:ADP-heptose:LPS heptosyltransferase